jgi:tRNA(Ile)-lysidine synthase
MLELSRKDIEAYLSLKNQSFRTDHTNVEETYTRNVIRKKWVNLYNDLLPGHDKTLPTTFQHLREAAAIQSHVAQQIWQQWKVDVLGVHTFSLNKLKQFPFATTLLHVWFGDYGLNAAGISAILNSNKTNEVKYFDVKKGMLFTQRGKLHWIKIAQPAKVSVGILEKPGSKTIVGPYKFETTLCPIHKAPSLADKDVAVIQSGNVVFPLLIRPWKKGDYFYPSGMKLKKKKVSDFFHNLKLMYSNIDISL